MSKFSWSVIFLLCSVFLGRAQQPAPTENTAKPVPAVSETGPEKKTPSNSPPGAAADSAPVVDPSAKTVPEKTVPGNGLPDKSPPDKSLPDKSGMADKGPKTLAGVDPNTYVIGPEDVLYIRVWKDQDLSGLVDVRPDGVISMQLVGEIKAAGLTPEQLAKVLTERLLETHKRPEVNIQVVKVLSKKYFIQGEVQRPGSYPLVVPTKVLEALVNAGGFKDFANPKKIYILRGTERLPFNFKDVSKGKHTEQNIMVQNGDQIFVP